MAVMNTQHDGQFQGFPAVRSAEDAPKPEQPNGGAHSLNPRCSAHQVRRHKRGGQS